MDMDFDKDKKIDFTSEDRMGYEKTNMDEDALDSIKEEEKITFVPDPTVDTNNTNNVSSSPNVQKNKKSPKQLKRNVLQIGSSGKCVLPGCKEKSKPPHNTCSVYHYKLYTYFRNEEDRKCGKDGCPNYRRIHYRTGKVYQYCIEHNPPKLSRERYNDESDFDNYHPRNQKLGQRYKSDDEMKLYLLEENKRLKEEQRYMMEKMLEQKK